MPGSRASNGRASTSPMATSAPFARVVKSAIIDSSSRAWSAVVTSSGHARQRIGANRCKRRRDGRARQLDGQPRVGGEDGADAFGLLGEDADARRFPSWRARRAPGGGPSLRPRPGSEPSDRCRGLRRTGRSQAATRRGPMLSSRSRQPGHDRAAVIAPRIGLRQPHRVEDQRNQGPQRDQLEPDVGPAEDQ